MTLSLSIILLLVATAITGADIAERVQPDLDTFVFCVLDKSVEQLPSDAASDEIAELAADGCSLELDDLESAVATQYREVNRGVWPHGMAEQVARENREEYRRLTIAAAVKILEERRASP